MIPDNNPFRKLGKFESYVAAFMSENDKKPLIKWFDKFEKVLKKLGTDYKKSSINPTDALEFYYDGKSPDEAAKSLKESVEHLDEAKDYRKELEKRHSEALDIMKKIDHSFGRTKWTDSFGNYVDGKMPDDVDTSIDAGWAYHQARGRGEWFFIIEPKDVVKYSYTGNAKIKSSEKSGRMKIGEFKKFIARVWALTKAKNESHLDERSAPLPKSTEFSVVYSYAGKDNKFVTKLTNIGGKVDRKNKEVRFDFDSASARTKFRKKNKEILSKLDESVELDEGKQLELLKKYGTTIMKMWDKEGASSDEIAKKLKLNSKDTKTLKGLMDESVELDEATREEPKVFWDFKSERDAKQFAKDVENSGVGLANSGVERYKGKYRVVITGMTKDMHKKAIGKYAHKNKGKFSHSTSEVTPKGYGPYDESYTEDEKKLIDFINKNW